MEQVKKYNGMYRLEALQSWLLNSKAPPEVCNALRDMQEDLEGKQYWIELLLDACEAGAMYFDPAEEKPASDTAMLNMFSNVIDPNVNGRDCDYRS